MVGATKGISTVSTLIPEVEQTLQTPHKLPNTSGSEESRLETFLLGFHALMTKSNNRAKPVVKVVRQNFVIDPFIMRVHATGYARLLDMFTNA